MSKIEGVDKLNRALVNLPSKLKSGIIRIINENSVEMQRYLREERLTGGTTDRALAVRTGKLRASVMVMKAVEEGTSIKGGVSIGTVYARPHFGPKGQETTIKPKKGKYLAIPLQAAKTPAGVPRGSPRYGPWTETFFAHSKKGNLILFGRKLSYGRVKVGGVAVRGLAIRKVGQEIIPLFVLKKEVKIKARIDPKDVINVVSPRILQQLQTIGLKS